MTYVAAFELLVKYGPLAVQQGLKLYEVIKAGKGQTEITPEDIAQLVAYGSAKGEDYFKPKG